LELLGEVSRHQDAASLRVSLEVVTTALGGRGVDGLVELHFSMKYERITKLTILQRVMNEDVYQSKIRWRDRGGLKLEGINKKVKE
jgi:hypothetical protein